MNTENTTPPSESGRKRGLLLLALFCACAAVAYATYWLQVARYQVQTDNAYVAGNIVQITPQVSGTIVAIDVEDTDSVKVGQMLVHLDPVDARVALDQAEAQLGQVVREVRAIYAGNQALAASIEARLAEQARSQADLERLSADLGRREALVEGGAVSGEEVQHLKSAVANARSAYAAASAQLREAQQQLLRNQSQTEGVGIDSHPRVLAAAGKYREAWLASKRLGIAAPVAGMVAKRSAQVGQRVAVGVPVMAIVPPEQLWVDANFKESQLASLRVGQSAKLSSDVYGQPIEFKGRISGLGAGTGSAFSLLPAQNATGNWIKIVQRVPVRIALDPADLAAHPLRIGLSMEVNVDVHDQSGKAVTQVARNTPVSSTTLYDDLDKAADVRVNAIISANLGHPVQLPRAK